MTIKHIKQNTLGDYIEEESEFDNDRTYFYVYDKKHEQIGAFSWYEQATEFLAKRELDNLVYGD